MKKLLFLTLIFVSNCLAMDKRDEIYEKFVKAIDYKDLKQVHEIIKSGIDVNYVPEGERPTPLGEAIAVLSMNETMPGMIVDNSIEIIKELLNAGAKVRKATNLYGLETYKRHAEAKNLKTVDLRKDLIKRYSEEK